MSPWIGLAAALLAGQDPAPAPRSPEAVAVVVVTLDDLRQGQARYGRGLLAVIESRGALAPAGSGPSEEDFASCRDEATAEGLDHCVRFYLRRSAGPVVAVAFDDAPAGRPHRGAGEMQASCFGAGRGPADAATQTTWLWPDAARLRGVNDWERDIEALAACIRAAAAETAS